MNCIFEFSMQNGSWISWKTLDLSKKVLKYRPVLSMSYYPEPDGHITDIVKVVFDLSNYATKKN